MCSLVYAAANGFGAHHFEVKKQKFSFLSGTVPCESVCTVFIHSSSTACVWVGGG
jgi:hypothetical protein